MVNKNLPSFEQRHPEGLTVLSHYHFGY